MNNHTPVSKIRLHHRAPGHSTKFWITPDGRFHDTGGRYHFRWAQANAAWLKDHYGVKVAPYIDARDEDPLRIHLVCQGMVRVNHLVRTNRLRIEGMAGAFSEKVVAALQEFITRHREDVCAVRANRFEAGGRRYTPFERSLHLRQNPFDADTLAKIKDLCAFLQEEAGASKTAAS